MTASNIFWGTFWVMKGLRLERDLPSPPFKFIELMPNGWRFFWT